MQFFCSVPRAETRLTVYRSLFIIRMLDELVADFAVERANIFFTTKYMPVIEIVTFSCL